MCNDIQGLNCQPNARHFTCFRTHTALQSLTKCRLQFEFSYQSSVSVFNSVFLGICTEIKQAPSSGALEGIKGKNNGGQDQEFMIWQFDETSRLDGRPT